MALTLKSTAKTGKGKLTIHFLKGSKSTLSVWCSHSEIKERKLELKSINGFHCEFHKILWNGQILN